MAVSTLGALAVFALPALGQYVMEHQNSIDWTDANAYCASTYGTTLATIKDDADASTLLAMKQNLGSYRVWIGLNDIETETEWVWASGYEWYTTTHCLYFSKSDRFVPCTPSFQMN